MKLTAADKTGTNTSADMNQNQLWDHQESKHHWISARHNFLALHAASFPTSEEIKIKPRTQNIKYSALGMKINKKKSMHRQVMSELYSTELGCFLWNICLWLQRHTSRLHSSELVSQVQLLPLYCVYFAFLSPYLLETQSKLPVFMECLQKPLFFWVGKTDHKCWMFRGCLKIHLMIKNRLWEQISLSPFCNISMLI